MRNGMSRDADSTIEGDEGSLFADKDARAIVRRVQIRNFKSIGSCSVELRNLTILLGKNGAGKSNFLDALRFVTDGLQFSLEQAVLSRGGIDAVRTRSTGHPRNFAVRLELTLPGFQSGTYEFEIAARGQDRFFVKHENLEITSASGESIAHYALVEGKTKNGSPAQHPAASADRLYLVAASSLPEFRPTYDALVSMGFYNLNPEAMKKGQTPDAGELLHRDGGNIASVIARLAVDKPDVFVRIREYLERIVPGVKNFERIALGPLETLEFRQEVQGSRHFWKFYPESISDGTLRVLGALTAVAQLANRRMPLTLVGIEEPETALHPAAAGALMDALREATNHTQVIVTTHSPDLLNEVNIDAETLFVVKAEEGTTRIARPDNASLQAIREHLYTPGELLRMDQLEPDLHDVQRQQQLSMSFDNGRDETV